MSLQEAFKTLTDELDARAVCTPIVKVPKVVQQQEVQPQLGSTDFSHTKILGSMLFSLHTVSADAHHSCSSTCNQNCLLCEEAYYYMKMVTSIHRKNNRINKCGKKQRRQKFFSTPEKYKTTKWYKADREFRQVNQRYNRLMKYLAKS